MVYQKNINYLLYIKYIMSLTLKQETIVTEGHTNLSNDQPTPTEYNNFPVSKLLIIDEDHYLIASQQISQDPVEEQGRPYIRKFELKLYARDFQNEGFHQSENPDYSRYVRYYISHSTQDNYNFDAILDNRRFDGNRKRIYVLNHDKIMQGDEDHDDANKIDLDVIEINNTILREVGQARNFIVPGYKRFRTTSHNVLDLEGDFWMDPGSKYGTKLAYIPEDGNNKILIGTQNGLVHIYDINPSRKQTLSYKNESYNEDTSFNDISRTTHILISPKYTYNTILIDNDSPRFGTVEDFGMNQIILQGAGEFINVWCREGYIYEDEDDNMNSDNYELKFSYNLIESLDDDNRSRKLVNHRSPESFMRPYLSAVSKDLIDCESLIVSIVVDGIVQGLKICFLGILYCGDKENVGENARNLDSYHQDIRRLWFPKLFTPGLNNNNAIQFDFVIDYPNMVRLGSNNGITVFEQSIITSIEILDPQHFVTGDSDGVIIIWKFDKEIDSYPNINGGVNTYGGDGEFSIVTYYQHTVPIDRGYTELTEYTDVNIKSIENIAAKKELLVHICGQNRRKPNKEFYNKIELLSWSLENNESEVIDINMDLLQEYDDYENICHTQRGKEEMMKNVNRVFEMKKDEIVPSVLSEQQIEEFRVVDIGDNNLHYDVMELDYKTIYDFANNLDLSSDCAIIFKTENKIYMYSKEVLEDMMNFPYDQIVYGCREASGEWRDENRINNIILDDLYVSLGTLLEERGLLVPLVSLLNAYEEQKGQDVISFCIINDRPEDMKRVPAVAMLPFNTGVGRLHCNPGGEDSAEIIYNVYGGHSEIDFEFVERPIPLPRPPPPPREAPPQPPRPPPPATTLSEHFARQRAEMTPEEQEEVIQYSLNHRPPVPEFDGVTHGNMIRVIDEGNEVFYQRINNIPVGDSGRINLDIVNVADSQIMLFEEGLMDGVREGIRTIDNIISPTTRSDENNLRESDSDYGDMIKIKMKDWLEDENGLIENIIDIESIELLHTYSGLTGQIIPRLINEVPDLNLFVGGGYDNDDKYVILVDDLLVMPRLVQYIYIGRYNRYRDYCQVIYRLGHVCLGVNAPLEQLPPQQESMEVVPPPPPSLGGKRKSNRKKSLKNKRKTKKKTERKTFKNKQRKNKRKKTLKKQRKK